jgi:outer membrane biosynthesis protein TonB
MADKTEKKKGAKTEPPKPETKPEPKPEAKAEAPKAEAKADSKAQAAKPAAAAAATGPRCRVPKCKQAARAKGYCRKHYVGWRRGDVGAKHRYKTCSKEGCRKPAVLAGRCEEHKRGAPEAASA